MVFAWWEERREKRGEDTLLDRALLKIEPLKAGLSTLATMQLVLLGTFFVLPVYLQVVLGLDAFETGKKLFPMSVSMLIAALLGPKMAARRSPQRVCQVGLVAMVVAALLLMGTIDVTLHGAGFAISLVLFGIGAGLLMSQLGNVIMSSAPPEESNEAGGLQGTAQNLGASLGTALIGAILLTTLTNSFVSRIQQNPDLPQRVQDVDHGPGGAGDRHRLRRPGAPGRARRRVAAQAGRRRRGGLRERPDRRAEGLDALRSRSSQRSASGSPGGCRTIRSARPYRAWPGSGWTSSSSSADSRSREPRRRRW